MTEPTGVSCGNGCYEQILTLRFEVRVKENEDPYDFFRKLLWFFRKYGILAASLDSGDAKELKTEKNGCFIVQRFQFTLADTFCLEQLPPVDSKEV